MAIKHIPEEQRHNIDFIQIKELKDFVSKSLEDHGDIEKLKVANEIVDIMLDLLKYKGLYDENTHQGFIDVMVSAGLLHNLFFKEDDWRTLYDARYHLSPIADEFKVHESMQDALFHTIEGQLGDRTPVMECRPKPATPTEVFSQCVWFYKKFKNN